MSSRPPQGGPGRSATAALTSAVLTLVVFLVVFLSFLFAPLLALGLIGAGFALMQLRKRTPRARPSARPTAAADGGPALGGHGFGSGVA